MAALPLSKPAEAFCFRPGPATAKHRFGILQVSSGYGEFRSRPARSPKMSKGPRLVIVSRPAAAPKMLPALLPIAPEFRLPAATLPSDRRRSRHEEQFFAGYSGMIWRRALDTVHRERAELFLAPKMPNSARDFTHIAAS